MNDRYPSKGWAEDSKGPGARLDEVANQIEKAKEEQKRLSERVAELWAEAEDLRRILDERLKAAQA